MFLGFLGAESFPIGFSVLMFFFCVDAHFFLYFRNDYMNLAMSECNLRMRQTNLCIIQDFFNCTIFVRRFFP